jgi:hypothetical protein
MIKRILLLATIALISFSSYANTLDMYLMGGPAFSRLSNNTAVQINDFLVNDYFTRTRSQTEPLLGFGVGRTFIPFSQPLSLTLGFPLITPIMALSRVAKIRLPMMVFMMP